MTDVDPLGGRRGGSMTRCSRKPPSKILGPIDGLVADRYTSQRILRVDR